MVCDICKTKHKKTCDFCTKDARVIKYGYNTVPKGLTKCIREFKPYNYKGSTIKRQINNIRKNCGNIYIVYKNRRVVSMCIVYILDIFSHNDKRIAHIEDLITVKKERGNGYASMLLRRIDYDLIKNNVYRLSLSCEKNLIPFYELNGYSKKENTMIKYYTEKKPEPPDMYDFIYNGCEFR